MIIDNQGKGKKMSHDKYSSIIYKGKTLKQWAKIKGVPYVTIRSRILSGYPIDVAISPKRIVI